MILLNCCVQSSSSEIIALYRLLKVSVSPSKLPIVIKLQHHMLNERSETMPASTSRHRHLLFMLFLAGLGDLRHTTRRGRQYMHIVLV